MSAESATSPLHGRGAIKLGAWFAAAQLIPLLVSPVLTRLYAPQEMGQWAIFAALIFVGGSAAPLRFDQVVVVARSRLHALDAALVAVICAGVCAAVAAAVVLSPPGQAAMRAFGAGAGVWSVLLAPCVLLLATALVVNGWLLRNGRFGAVGVVRIGQSALGALLAVGFGIAGVPHGLVAAQVAGLTVTGAASAWMLSRAVAATRRPRAARLCALARRYRQFPLHGAPAMLLSTLGIYLPLLVFGRLFGEAESGQFALARQCLIAVAGVLSAATGQAFMLASTQCVRSRGSLMALLRRQLMRQCALAAGFLVAAIFLAAPSFEWIFGAQWGPAGRYAAWLAAPIAAALLVSPVSSLLLAVERVRTNSAWQACWVGALALLALPDYDSPTDFLLALILVESVSYAAYLLLIVHAAREHDRVLRP